MRTTPPVKAPTLSETLSAFIHQCPKQTFTLNELSAFIGKDSFSIIILIMALPNALMLATLPGVSSIFGTVLVITSLQMLRKNRTLSLPSFLGNKNLSKESTKKTITKASPYLDKIQSVLKNRWKFMLSDRMHTFLSALCLLHSLLICLPIPMANLVPGIILVFISIGMISKDGFLIFLSIVMSLIFFYFIIGVYKFIFIALYNLIPFLNNNPVPV